MNAKDKLKVSKIQFLRAPHKWGSLMHQDGAQTVEFMFGNQSAISTIDPKLIHQVMTNGKRYASVVLGKQAGQELFAPGLATFFSDTHAHGDRRAMHLQILRPVLTHPEVVKRFVDTGREELRQWLKYHNGDIINLYPALKKLTLRIAVKGLFCDSDPDNPGRAELTHHFEKGIRNRMILSVLTPDIVRPLISLLRLGQGRLNYRRQEITRLAREILDQPASSMLLDALRSLPLEDQEAETAGILVASFETTAVSLFWMFVMLAMHPTVFTRLRNGEVSGHQVAKETLRFIGGPVSVLSRYDLELQQNVFIIPWIFHRNPVLMADADKFNVDRRAGEKTQAIRDAVRNVAWGHGEHHCIGRTPAEAFLDASAEELGQMLTGYELTNTSDWEVMRATNGMTMPSTYQQMVFSPHLR
jgi:cytochrome P450